MKYPQWLTPFIIALTLLTRLPVYTFLPASQRQQAWSTTDQSLSVLFYPLVGAVLAVLLIMLWRQLQ